MLDNQYYGINKEENIPVKEDKTMKIKFDNSLPYQQDAIESVVDVFKGQEICDSNFTVYSPDFLAKNSLFTHQERTNLLGYANRLQLTDGQLMSKSRHLNM